MNATDQVRAYLAEHGPTTRSRLSEALGMPVTHVINATQGLVRKGEASSVPGEHWGRGRPESLYGLTGEHSKVSQKSIVSVALANRHELEKVWS